MHNKTKKKRKKTQKKTDPPAPFEDPLGDMQGAQEPEKLATRLLIAEKTGLCQIDERQGNV